MSWHYLQEGEEASWEASSLAGAPSALLRLLPTQGASCLQDNEMDCSTPSPSGMMSRPLTGHPGKDTSMSSAVAFPAKTSALQEVEKESAERSLDSGERWPASWVRYEAATSSWRTAQCSLLGGLEQFSETWPKWGTMRGGECWGHTMPGHLTSEKESGLWPTPTAYQGPQEGNVRLMRKKIDNGEITREEAWSMIGGDPFKKQGAIPARKNWPTPTLAAQAGGKLNPMWVEWLMGWPIGWTDLEPLATDKSLHNWRSHGECCHDEW